MGAPSTPRLSLQHLHDQPITFKGQFRRWTPDGEECQLSHVFSGNHLTTYDVASEPDPYDGSMRHLETGVDEHHLSHLDLKARLLTELTPRRLLHGLIDLYVATGYAPHAIEQGATASNKQNPPVFDQHNRDAGQRVSIEDEVT